MSSSDLSSGGVGGSQGTAGADERRALAFVDYAIARSDEGEGATLDGLRERAELVPEETLRAAVLAHGVLHRYVGRCGACADEGGRRQGQGGRSVAADVDLEVVRYLLELAPDAVRETEDGTAYAAHPYGEGALPLHLACFNADCPASVVKLLLDMNPAAARVSWDNKIWGEGYGLPLNCYLERACRHKAYGHYTSVIEEDAEWIEDFPALPSGELDYDIVKMLVEAYTEALTCMSYGMGTPLRTLCRGYDVTMEFVHLLMENDDSLDDDGEEEEDTLVCPNRKSPIMALLGNSLVSPFPIKIFRFLLERNPSALVFIETNAGDWRNQSALHVACSNETMNAEAVELIIDTYPAMAQVRCDGLLPLHALCRNKKMDEQSAIDIMKLLVGALPESLKQRVGRGWPLMSLGKKIPVQIAERNMNLSFTKSLLTEHVRLSSTPKTSILHMACVCNCSLETIKRFVDDDRGLLLRKDGHGQFPLHVAAKSSSLEVVKYLVDEDQSTLRKMDEDGRIPLHVAAKFSSLEVVKYLVDEDQSTLRMMDEDERIPLHLAAEFSAIEVVKYLTEQDENALTVPDMMLELPLHKACKKGKYDVVRYLMGQDVATISAKNISGELPLCNFNRWGKKSGKLRSDKHTAVVLDMLSAHYKIVPSENLLQIACLGMCSLSIIKHIAQLNPELLLQKGGGGFTPLHAAAMISPSETVKYLVRENKCALMVKDEKGRVPLHIAVEFSSDEVVKYLVDQNESALVEKDEKGRVPLHIAVEFDSIEVVKYLIEKNESTLMEKDEEGCIPLHVAVEFSSIEVMKYLIEQNESTLMEKDEEGRIPLHRAAELSSTRVVKYLVRRNESTLDAQDEMMEAPLHKACRTGACNVIKYLVKKNMAAITAKNFHGKLPLHILCDPTGKSEEWLQSVKYTSTVFDLLVAHPESVNV